LSSRAFVLGVVVLSCMYDDVMAKPTFTVAPTINLGSPIHVNYEFTDNIDGRYMTTGQAGTSGTGKFITKTGSDWIGLFKKDDCSTSVNTQDKNKCYVHWEYVPQGAKTGTIVFEAAHYKDSGEYEARYFYGDDPTIPGALAWVGQGYVCNTWIDSNADGNLDTYVPATGAEGSPTLTNVKLEQCQCDITAGTQTISFSDGVTPPQTGVTQATCLSYHAACGRCAVDAVATSPTVTVIGSGGVDTYQDMSMLPGFEIAF